MAITTRSNGRVTQPRRQIPKLVAQPNLPLEGQNDPQTPPMFPPPSTGEHNQMAALEPQIPVLMKQNAKLLL
jgi:hypothetical protein